MGEKWCFWVSLDSVYFVMVYCQECWYMSRMVRHLSIRDVATSLRLSTDRVRRMAVDGTIDGFFRPAGMGDWRIAETDFEAFLERSKRMTWGEAA